jgi:hypothetical protein
VATARSLLHRVRALESARVHPLLGKIGGAVGWAAVKDEVEAGIAEGRYDSREVPGVILCLERWLTSDRLE